MTQRIIAGTLTNMIVSGTLSQLNNISSIGTITQLTNLSTIGTISQLNNLSSIGTISDANIHGTIGNFSTSAVLPTVTKVSQVESGSVGILGFNSGALLPNVSWLGTVNTIKSVASGSVGIMEISPIGTATIPFASTYVYSDHTVQILVANTNRKYASIQATGDTFLSFSGTAMANQGLKVSSTGKFEINQLNLWTGQVTGIRDIGSGTVFFVEW